MYCVNAEYLAMGYSRLLGLIGRPCRVLGCSKQQVIWLLTVRRTEYLSSGYHVRWCRVSGCVIQQGQVILFSGAEYLTVRYSGHGLLYLKCRVTGCAIQQGPGYYV